MANEIYHRSNWGNAVSDFFWVDYEIYRSVSGGAYVSQGMVLNKAFYGMYVMYVMYVTYVCIYVMYVCVYVCVCNVRMQCSVVWCSVV